MNKISLCLGIFTLLYGTSIVVAAAQDPLGEVPIEIKARVVGETCEILNDYPGEIVVDIGDIPLDSIKKATGGMGLNVKIPSSSIKFKCSSGKSAKFTLKDVGETCSAKGLSGWWYKCAGENKTVGMIANFSYKPGSTPTQDSKIVGKGGMPNNIYNLFLDKESEGTVNIPSVEVSKLIGIEPSPGLISTTYLLTLWAE